MGSSQRGVFGSSGSNWVAKHPLAGLWRAITSFPPHPNTALDRHRQEPTHGADSALASGLKATEADNGCAVNNALGSKTGSSERAMGSNSALRRCPRCSFPGGLIRCPRCHLPKAHRAQEDQ